MHSASLNAGLLSRFLVCAARVLAPGGEIHIVSSQHKKQFWRIDALGAAGGMYCSALERHSNPFPSYRPQRSRGGALSDDQETVRVYTFRHREDNCVASSDGGNE